MEITDVLRRPVVSEKSMNDAGGGKYTFIVAKWANKYQIKKAVENQFGVKVTGVKTTIIKGKSKRSGKKRLKVRVGDIKKAKVSLVKGQKIDIFETREG